MMMKDDSTPLPPRYKNRDRYPWEEAVDIFAHVRYRLFMDDNQPDTGVGDIIRRAKPGWFKAEKDLRARGIEIAEDGSIDGREFADLFERLGHPGVIGFSSEPPRRKKPHKSLDAPLRETERRTLLVIIEAMARELPIETERPHAAAARIEKMTEKLGARVDQETIARHLRLIPEALEARTK